MTKTPLCVGHFTYLGSRILLCHRWTRSAQNETTHNCTLSSNARQHKQTPRWRWMLGVPVPRIYWWLSTQHNQRKRCNTVESLFADGLRRASKCDTTAQPVNGHKRHVTSHNVIAMLARGGAEQRPATRMATSLSRQWGNVAGTGLADSWGLQPAASHTVGASLAVATTRNVLCVVFVILWQTETENCDTSSSDVKQKIVKWGH
jgi:hypothetical protein